MAFFIRNTVRTFSTILRKTPTNQSFIFSACNSNLLPKTTKICALVPMQIRNSSRIAANDIDLSTQPNIEIIKNPPEWKYVERVLPQATIPELKPKAEYPSGYKPQSKEAFNYPYFIRRSRNHMIPVYLKLTFRNTRRQTIIKNIKGDIWELNREITKYVENYMARRISTRVNEFTGQIVLIGDHVNLVKDYLLSKGF